MLELRIDKADLTGRWSYRNGAWVNGGSSIAPFAHPSIETDLLELPEHQLIVVRENPSAPVLGAGREPGGDAERRIETGDPAAIVASLISWPLNVVVVAFPKGGDAAVNIYTGMSASAPLFLAPIGHVLRGAWDVADLYPHLPFAVDPGRAAYTLCHFGLPYSRRTLFPGVQQLTERGVASWRRADQRLEVCYPAPLLRAMPRRLAEGADILAAFETLLGAAIRRSANGGIVASELSGGLDSGVATLVAARVLGADRVFSFGLLLPGKQKPSQQARRSELADRAGVCDMPVDSDALGPFGRGDIASTDPVIPWGEYYREAFLALGHAIATKGCRVVIRGIGGDEISELTAGEHESNAGAAGPSAVADRFPGFLTEAAKQAYAVVSEDLDEAPAGFAASSFYQAAAASAPVYLRRGIWPIYPYGTPEVVDFCRSLPAEWRVDRTLQRSFLRASGLSAEVVRPTIPETFLPLRDLMFGGPGADYVRDIFRRPLLAELGLVDAVRLNVSFEDAVRRPDAPERAYLLEAATMETMLRTWRRQSEPMGP